MKRMYLIASLLLIQTSCVGGYSSGGGWFFWPGGLVGLLVVLALFLFMRRSR